MLNAEFQVCDAIVYDKANGFNVGADIIRPQSFIESDGRQIAAPTLWCTIKL